MTERVINKTNNFWAMFNLEILPPDEKAKLEDPERAHPFFYSAYKKVQELERIGGLWTRFKGEQADLYFAIQDQVRKTDELQNDMSRFVELLSDQKFCEAHKFKDDVRLGEREKVINARMTPMINYAFDILVAQGADAGLLRL